jgi:hypothetical protein
VRLVAHRQLLLAMLMVQGSLRWSAGVLLSAPGP